jgi:hypothetical protein
MSAPGSRRWVIPGGEIPMRSNGREPLFTSHDLISVLNTSDSVASIELTLCYHDVEPVEGYCFDVQPRRVRRVRVNDLIDPLAVQLGVAYGILVECNVPVVVQFTRQDTSDVHATGMTTIAWGY